MIWCFSLFFSLCLIRFCVEVYYHQMLFNSAIFAFVMGNWVYTIQNTQKLPKAVNMI